MLDKQIAEATECDFKERLERRKPKSWLKSVSAFANGIGGTLFFGIDNDRHICGLCDPQSDAEEISRRIKERITPLPRFILTPVTEEGKAFLCLNVSPGASTPYYYKADGIMEAYIRSGNESILAPSHILNELILKGSNRTFDGLLTEARLSDYSFSVLKATYLERTGIHFEDSDFISFGLADTDGYLTNAGKLLADQHIVYNARIFCTRWNGLEKGSLFDDALDDKEYGGNLIGLLQNGRSFILNNSKVRFSKEAMYRVDKPDYAERAVTEILVNALIHRDYVIPGREIHIDMYDDRLEISSPGGMYEGDFIQNRNIRSMNSSRRNPVIADIFQRMKFMERRGSGLKKILDETAKLPGYAETMKPVFTSTPNTFTVVLKNVNYSPDPYAVQDGRPAYRSDRIQDRIQDGIQDERTLRLLAFCSIPRSREEMQAFVGISNRAYFMRAILTPLLNDGKLLRTIPDRPSSKHQKYYSQTQNKRS